MATLKLVLRDQKRKEDGTCPVYLRITEDRKTRFVATQVYVDPKHWNAAKQEVRRTHPSAVALNDRLSHVFHEGQSTAFEHRSSKRAGATAEAVSAAIKGERSAEVYDFAGAFAERLRVQGLFHSYKRVLVMITKLKGHFEDRVPTFVDLDADFLAHFERYMREELGNRANTIAKDFQVLRRVVKEAVRDRLMAPGANPFVYHKVRTEKTTKTKLSFDQIKALEALALPDGSALAVARDAFLFSFYCAGVRFGDLCQLRWENVEGGRLRYRMGKTGSLRDYPLIPQTEAILARYRKGEPKPDGLIFPILRAGRDYSNAFFVRQCISSRNVVVNKQLKRLAAMASITEHVSFHVSRHSFADYARSSKIDLYDVSKMLGHHSLKVTETYLKALDTRAQDLALTRLFGAHDV